MERTQLITQLSATVNKVYGSRITPQMMEAWVGSDATNADIAAYEAEVDASEGRRGVTPQDVFDILDPDEDYGLKEED